jgi:predicted lactoylglutathione lyase
VDVSVGSKGNLVTLSLDSRDAIPALVEAVTRNGGRLFDLQTKHRSLEDLYVSLIKGEGGPP